MERIEKEVMRRECSRKVDKRYIVDIMKRRRSRSKKRSEIEVSESVEETWDE